MHHHNSRTRNNKEAGCFWNVVLCFQYSDNGKSPCECSWC